MELAIYEAFRDAGIDEKPAKAIAETINKAMEYHYAVHSQQLATKGDTEHLRLEIERVRGEVEKVRGEIEKSKNDIIKWIVASVIAGIGVAAVVTMAIARLFFTA